MDAPLGRNSTVCPAATRAAIASKAPIAPGCRTSLGTSIQHPAIPARLAACECVALLGGEDTECGPRRTLAEQGQDVSAVLAPIREFVADVPAPGGDHRKDEPYVGRW